jgi:hypothetical protein
MVAIFVPLVLGDAAVASAKANHHDAKKLLGDNLIHGGHDINHRGEYITSVKVSHARIAAVRGTRKSTGSQMK